MSTVQFNLKKWYQFLALGFGSGLAAKAPGTFGTIAAVPLVAFLLWLGNNPVTALPQLQTPLTGQVFQNGQLISLYAHAYQLTNDEFYKTVFTETIDFIDRELTSPAGGFYSSLNAETDGDEGAFYAWNYDAFVKTTGKENAASIAAMILTTEALITDVPEKDKPAPPPMPEY